MTSVSSLGMLGMLSTSLEIDSFNGVEFSVKLDWLDIDLLKFCRHLPPSRAGIIGEYYHVWFHVVLESSLDCHVCAAATSEPATSSARLCASDSLSRIYS